MENIKLISPIPESKFANIVVFMENNYDKEEPINEALGPFNDAMKKDYGLFHLNSLKDGISAMAVDNNNEVSMS